MDEATVNYYSANATAIAERYESIVSGLSESFREAFHSHSKILDIGCGSGRDLAVLAGLGHDCYGMDATREMVSLSQSLHPELKDRIAIASLPEFEPPFGGDFDGVLCSAVLMHLPVNQLEAASISIKRCMRGSGRLLYSVPSKRLDVVTDDRDANGRLFVPDQAGRLQQLFEKVGFRLIDKWDDADSLGRDSVNWVSVLMELYLD